MLDRDLGLRTRELFESWIALLKLLELPFYFLLLGIQMEMAWLICRFYTHTEDASFLAELLDQAKTRVEARRKALNMALGWEHCLQGIFGWTREFTCVTVLILMFAGRQWRNEPWDGGRTCYALLKKITTTKLDCQTLMYL